MAAKKKAAKAGAGAYAAGKAVRSNEYVQRLATDEELRENLRSASSRRKRRMGGSTARAPRRRLTTRRFSAS